MTRTIRRSLLTLAAALMAAACDDPTAPTPVADIDISPMPMMLTVGETVQLTALPIAGNGLVLDRTVRWRSSAPAVATVDAAGLLAAHASGDAMLTATSGDVSVSFLMSVVPVSATSLMLDVADLNFAQGGTATATAIVKDAQGQVLPDVPVEWTSRHPAVATVDQAGNIQMVAPGVTWVVARYGALKDSTSVTVRPPAAGAAR